MRLFCQKTIIQGDCNKTLQPIVKKYYKSSRYEIYNNLIINKLQLWHDCGIYF